MKPYNSFIIAVVVVMVLFGTTAGQAQPSVERPSQIAQDLKQISVLLDDVSSTEKQFAKRLRDYNDDLTVLSQQIETLPAGSRARSAAVEKFERVWSQALTEQYGFLKNVITSRNKVIKLLERASQSVPKTDQKVRAIFANQMARLDQAIATSEIELKRRAVLMLYASASPEERDDLARESQDLEQQKLNIQRNFKVWLTKYQESFGQAGLAVGNFQSRLTSMLSALKSRSTKLDMMMDKIKTVAAVRKEFAGLRLTFTDFERAWQVFRDYFKEAKSLEQDMDDLFGHLDSDVLQNEMLPVEHTTDDLPISDDGGSPGDMFSAKTQRIDAEAMAKRILNGSSGASTSTEGGKRHDRQ